MTTITGGCQCGAVRYALSAPPREIYVCHCRECQMQSGSAFGVSAIVPADALTVTKGSPRTWSRRTDAGGRLDCRFCPDCGTRLFHVGADRPDEISVKGGSLDTPPDLTAARHIWTKRKLSGVILPTDADTFEQEPT